MIKINRKSETMFLMTTVMVVFLAGFQGCEKQKPPKQAAPDMVLPVKVEANVSQDTVMSDNVIDMDFAWTLLADKPPIESDYKVLLHFIDEKGEVLFQDDHEPPVPTTEWKKDQPVTYSRPIYIPFSVEQFNTSVVVGLYDRKNMQKKIGLTGMKTSDKPGRYAVSQLIIHASNDFTLDTERMDFKTGWFPLERDVQHRLQWRWTKKEAVCALRNPGKDAV